MIHFLRRSILTLAISFTLAVESAGASSALQERPPIVYRMDYIPLYPRRRPAKKHHAHHRKALAMRN